MICKQKKLVKVLLLTVVVSLFTMTTAFAQEYPTQNNNARYIGISMLNADLSIDDNGKSSCSGNVTLNNRVIVQISPWNLFRSIPER